MIIKNPFLYFYNLITANWEKEDQVSSNDGRQRKEKWRYSSDQVDAEATIDYYEGKPISIHLGQKLISRDD